jgi:hypothetical protein
MLKVASFLRNFYELDFLYGLKVGKKGLVLFNMKR